MFRRLARIVTPVAAMGAGFAVFPTEWRKNKWEIPKISYMNEDVARKIENSELYRTLSSQDDYEVHRNSETFPVQHKQNYLSQGILFGRHLFELDPIIFVNKTSGELTGFYHLGKDLVSSDGKVHNGITSTIMDEGLCTCGFPLLPSKRGVTAQLSINFKNRAPPDSTVILTAKVVQSKGRKVVIDGTLSTFPLDGGKPMEIATGSCVLVEPRWFKYFRWLDL